MRFHCLQHVVFESPGSIIAWIRQQGHTLHYTHLYRDDPFPGLDEFDVLIIMGGPMSVHDEKEFPWLKKEKDLIAAAMGQKKKILGICLGAQLIAEASGARVYPNPLKEIGFFPVNWTQAARDWIRTDASGTGKAGEAPGAFDMLKPGGAGAVRPEGAAGVQLPAVSQVFHWHGETFDLPEGAVRLASTGACTNQAFLLGGNVLGLQFHLEAEAEIIREMIVHEGHELVPAEAPAEARAAYIQTASAILGQLQGLGEDLRQGSVPGEGPRGAEEPLARTKMVLGLLLNRFLNV
jgi:GMP synthase-like glutamine amidotransferase